MAEGVTFWLENKNSTGSRVAQIDDQVLVSYRDRFYLVRNGAAVTKGGKPLRYSQSSLPAVWKKVLRDGAPVPVTPVVAEQHAVAPVVARKAPVKKVRGETVMPKISAAEIASPTLSAPDPLPEVKAAKATRKSTEKPGAQAVVVAECPYCGHKHEIPVEKGRSGKPFFQSCTKCQKDFAIRFVQVTLYQAQVAGFR